MQIPVLPILESKKFLAAALASVVAFLGLERGMDYGQIAFVVGPLLAYVGGQALADVGKERAKIERAAPPPAPPASPEESNR